MHVMKAYDRLMERAKEITILQGVGGVLGWDLETYMPPKGAPQRGEQSALVGRMIHRARTSPEIGELLKEIGSSLGELDDEKKRNFEIFRKDYNESLAIPEDLVADTAKQRTVALVTWKKAKAAKDWKMFLPELEKVIKLHKKRYELLMEVKGTKNIYDAMIDDYEPGMNQDKISRVFTELRNGLVPITAKCAETSREVVTDFMSIKVPAEIQRKIAVDLANFVQYDTVSEHAGGRIDEVVHPFTTGYYDDVRITLNYHENDFSSALFATLHEAGHALYEQNFNPDWKYQPLGQASSMGIHESMSRFIENMVGRTPQFWKYYLPRLNEFVGGAFSGIDLMDFIRAANLVAPSKTRVEADEVTYSLHVIIRFEIERDLMADKIQISELPTVWNEKYMEYLGVQIDNDSEGVLQDIHWAMGLIGYFPCYALGNVYDGMWLNKIDNDIPGWTDGLTRGEFSSIKKWLVENIHSKARFYEPDDLVMQVTGKELTATPFLDYIDKKYAELFGV